VGYSNVARIRPPGISSRDSDLVRQVCDETDFIINISPDEADLEHVSGTFLNLLRTYQPQLSATYAPIGHWLGAPAERHSTSGPARRSATSESGLTWIYVGGRGSKVALPLAHQLIDTGLAVTQPDHHYLGFHPKLGAERSIWQC